MAKDSHSLLLPHLRSPTSESFHLQLQEWIVEQYRRKCAADKSRTDGYSTSDLVRQFRHKFKIDIQFAIAAGLGAMIQAAHQLGDLGSS